MKSLGAPSPRKCNLLLRAPQEHSTQSPSPAHAKKLSRDCCQGAQEEGKSILRAGDRPERLNQRAKQPARAVVLFLILVLVVWSGVQREGKDTTSTGDVAVNE